MISLCVALVDHRIMILFLPFLCPYITEYIKNYVFYAIYSAAIEIIDFYWFWGPARKSSKKGQKRAENRGKKCSFQFVSLSSEKGGFRAK